MFLEKLFGQVINILKPHARKCLDMVCLVLRRAAMSIWCAKMLRRVAIVTIIALIILYEGAFQIPSIDHFCIGWQLLCCIKYIISCGSFYSVSTWSCLLGVLYL